MNTHSGRVFSHHTSFACIVKRFAFDHPFTTYVYDESGEYLGEMNRFHRVIYGSMDNDGKVTLHTKTIESFGESVTACVSKKV